MGQAQQEEQANSRGGVQSQVAAALHRATGRLVAGGPGWC